LINMYKLFLRNMWSVFLKLDLSIG
jgi:hypothetical protein